MAAKTAGQISSVGNGMHLRGNPSLGENPSLGGRPLAGSPGGCVLAWRQQYPLHHVHSHERVASWRL